MKNSADRKIWFRGAAVALISFVVILAIYILPGIFAKNDVQAVNRRKYSYGLFTFFENKTYDVLMKATAGKYIPSDEIVFVIVNQDSLTWAKETRGWSWPWPRESYAQLIDFFSAGNAKSIAFDMIYSEDSFYGEEDDQRLAQSEADSGKVIQTIFISGEGTDKEDGVLPIPPICNNAALIGNVTSRFDNDDMVRRARMAYEYDGVSYPSLGLAPLYLNGEEDGISDIPKLKDGTALIRYPSTIDDFHPYSVRQILESYDKWVAGETGDYVPEDFEDFYVFYALYAPGLYDICSTPVSQSFPGVGVHILTLDNYLNNSFIREVPSPLVILWFFLLCLFGAAVVTFAGSRQKQRFTVLLIVAGFLLGVGITIGLPFLLFANGYYLVVINAMLCFILTFLVCLGLTLSVEGKQKRFIKSAFSQCLSKDVVNQIVNDPSSFTLGGKKFQMSAIFTDIQKFSSFSELLTAGELGALLNFYLTKMSDIIIEEKGTVDKYEGDAIVALVGAPLEMEDHAVRACTAAVKMKKAEAVLNEEIVSYAAGEKPAKMDEELYSAFKKMVENKKTIFTRIGINSGEMIAGYFGSENKKNYTMMGNNVNLASRLEGVNKQYHTNGILVSEATRNLLGDNFIVRRLDRVRVVNVNTPIRLYEVLELADQADEKLCTYVQEWEKALDAFENKNYDDAKVQLEALLSQTPNDNVAKYYLQLLTDYFLKGTYPTEADDVGVAWNSQDGVFKLLQK